MANRFALKFFFYDIFSKGHSSYHLESTSLNSGSKVNKDFRNLDELAEFLHTQGGALKVYHSVSREFLEGAPYIEIDEKGVRACSARLDLVLQGIVDELEGLRKSNSKRSMVSHQP